MTGLEHEADGSWLVPLLLLVAICWQLWVWLRYAKPTDGDTEAKVDNKAESKIDNKPAGPAWLFLAEVTGLYRERQPVAPIAQDNAPPPESPFAAAVHDIRRHDHGFAIDRFLDDAQTAYETIATAFAMGDKDALAALVTPEVHATYAAAIATREDGDKRTKTALVRLAKPQLLDIAIHDGAADIRVRFVATWLSVRAGSEHAVENIAIANAASDTVDEWTFTRRLGAHDANWWLAASN
ncbi:MAG: Tim44/TimA family putative adaptor protein [Xanthobacteraceae bacterium]